MPPEKEVIKQQMDQTRAALSEKLETLENKVFGTVQDTTHTVSSTVHDVSNTLTSTVHNVGDSVRDTMHNVQATVTEVVASVRDALDVTRQVRQHPWLMMGGSVVAGYVGGRVLESVESGRFPIRATLPSSSEQFFPTGAQVERESYEPAPVSAPAHRSFLGELASTFAPEIAKVKGMALGMALGLLRDKISESVPPQFQGNVTELLDRFTVKLGGEPTPPGTMAKAAEDWQEHNGPETVRSTHSM